MGVPMAYGQDLDNHVGAYLGGHALACAGFSAFQSPQVKG